MRKGICTMTWFLMLVSTQIAHAQCTVNYGLSYAVYTAVSIDNMQEGQGGPVPGSGSVTIGGTEQSAQVCTQHLAGGDCGRYRTQYDSGTLSVAVNGFSESVNYGQGTTVASIASTLISAFNSDANSPVTASAVGNVISLTARTAGAGTNYSFSATATTNYPSDFDGASFSGTASGPTLDGGTEAGTSGQLLSSVLIDGSASMTIDPNSCPYPYYENMLAELPYATHGPSVYNAVNGAGGWVAGTSECVTCYLSQQSDLESSTVTLELPTTFASSGQVICSMGGVIFFPPITTHSYSIRLSAYVFYGLSSGRCAWVPSCAGKCSSQHTTNTNDAGGCWTTGPYKQCFDLLQDGICWSPRVICYGKSAPGICTN